AGDVGGERRRKVDVLVRQRVAERRPQWLPVRIGHRVGVAGFASPSDGHDRPPEIVAILDTPGTNGGVGHGDVEQREHPSVLTDRVVLLYCDDPGDLVEKARRVPQATGDVIAPENPDLRLVSGPFGTRLRAQPLDLHVGHRVLQGVQTWNRRNGNDIGAGYA